MHLSKSKREALRRLFNGCCAYCGEVLPAQGWHAEAISQDLVEGGVIPVCSNCRQIKGNASPEEFKELLEEQVERALRHSINFRTAMRFGLVSERSDKVEFWFQRCAVSGGQKKAATHNIPPHRFLSDRELHQPLAETSGKNL